MDDPELSVSLTWMKEIYSPPADVELPQQLQHDVELPLSAPSLHVPLPHALAQHVSSLRVPVPHVPFQHVLWRLRGLS